MNRLMVMAVAVVMLAAGDFLDAAEYTVNGWKLEVSLVPDKATFMVGVPIYLSFKVCNRSEKVFWVFQGGDTLNEFSREDSFTLEAISETGVVIPMLSAGQTGGSSVAGLQRIPVNGSYSFSLFLPHWLNLADPGRYTITAKRRLNVNDRSEFSDFQRGLMGDKFVDAEASTKVTVKPMDKAQMGRVIDEWAQLMLGKNEDAARRAAEALAAINDERTIGYFSRAVDGAYYGAKYKAVQALEKFNNDAALAALNKAALDTDDNIRIGAAYALSRSLHPRAMAALLARWKDSSRGVRLVVLHALGKMQSAESLDMIRTMTKDPDEMVSLEAERYLKLRTSAVAKPAR